MVRRYGVPPYAAFASGYGLRPYASRYVMMMCRFCCRSLAIFAVVLTCLGLSACTARKCPDLTQTSDENRDNSCLPPVSGDGHLYETWTQENGNIHAYYGGLDFDVGSHEGAKYLERKSVTPWLEPEYISSEIAAEDALGWAGGRYVRWLASTSTTVHFPFYPEDWEGDLSVSIELRPKINPSMAVRFYKPDGTGGRVWSDPLTTDLTPGWHGYRWRVPREYLAKDGMQIMRFSFPGTYFEGDNRVSSKIVNIRFGVTNNPVGKYTIQPVDDRNMPKSERILDQSLNAFGIQTGNRLERFMFVPENGRLRFYAAPGSWLDHPGKLKVEIMVDADKQEQNRQILSELEIKPGECWKLQDIDLSEYAHQAVRLMVSFQEDESEVIFSKSRDFHPDVYISEPEIRINDEGIYDNAVKVFQQPKRVVILAIDNLRADRIWVESKRRATPVLSRMADDGLTGILMGEGISLVSTTASFLTSVPADVHKVYAPGTHVREVLTSIAEAAEPQGWRSHFYSTSGSIDSTRGFAQGFDTLQQLNKENIYDARSALSEVGTAIASSDEKSLYYVHLSELRLPHRASDEKMELWGVPGYNGPVDMAAMQNIAVMREPGTLDAKQFEAYYDAELSSVDDAIGEFLGRIPDNTLVVVYGTHGCSLGESTLGYEQGLTPWELLMPFIFYMPGQQIGIRRDGIAKASDLSISILDLIGADMPAGARTIFELHDSRPSAQTEGLTATASMNDFYRIRREGVDILFTTGLDGTPAHENSSPAPIKRQALREKID